jgi:hypothetical protein
MWEGILWLEGFLGFEPRFAESQLLIARLCTGTLVRPLCLQGNAGVPRLCIKLYPGICLTTEENHGKTSVGVAEKRPTEDCWARFVWSTWWRPVKMYAHNSLLQPWLVMPLEAEAYHTHICKVPSLTCDRL